MATSPRFSTLALHPENRRVTKPIYCAVEQGGALVGDFDVVEGVDLAADVRALKQRLATWSADLAGVEPRRRLNLPPPQEGPP